MGPRLRGGAAAVALMLALASGGPVWAGPAGADGEYFVYVVEPGDTLFTLAQRYTGQAQVWRELQTLNRVPDPLRLEVGSRVRIPLARIPMTVAEARVVSVVGQAYVDGQALRRGMRLAEASWLETAADGMVTFELSDRSRVAMPPGTRVQVKRLRVFTGTGLGDTILQADRGSVESAVAPEGKGVGRFEVRTPMMVTGVRGTRFEVDAGQPGKRIANSAVREGAVAIRTSRQAITVPAGYGVAVDPRGRQALRKLMPAPVLSALPPMPIYANNAEVAWQPVAGATGYKVTVTTDAERTEAMFRAIVSTPSVRLTGLSEGRLWLAVSALDQSGIAGDAAVAELAVRLNPPAPFTIEPPARATHYGDTVAFSWATVDSAAGYVFELAADAAFAKPVVQTRVDGTSVSQTVAPGQWWWRVRSLDAKGEPGPWGAAIGFTALPQPPGPSVGADNGGPLQLSWGDGQASGPYAAAGYRVQLAADPAFAEPLRDIRVSGNEAALERPGAGVYYIRIARVERDGTQSPFSSPQRIELHELLRDSNGTPIGADGGMIRRGG